LNYAADYQEGLVYEDFLARSEEQGIVDPEIEVGCYGGLESHVNGQYYVILDCSGHIERPGSGGGGGGGGSAGTAVYLVTDQSTKQVPLRTGVDLDRPLVTVSPSEDGDTRERRTIVPPTLSLAIANLSEERHSLAVSITDPSSSESKSRFSHEYDLGPLDGVEQNRAVLRNGKYETAASIENGTEETFSWVPQETPLFELVVYIRPDGTVESHQGSYSPRID
jgi:hypothetical protein